MNPESFDHIFSGIQAIVTSLSIIAAGIWAYWKFIFQQEKYPNIIFSTDINFIGKQNNEWLIEVIAIIENKGKAQHKMKSFCFDINALFHSDKLISLDKWGGQVDFPSHITKGSFLPSNRSFFFVDPGTTAKYSFVTKISDDVSFVILHSYFDYSDERKYIHSAEKTIKVPKKISAKVQV
jgi:hypothetical protein